MDPKLFLIYSSLVAIPVIPLAVWKIFTLPPKVGPLDDVRTTLGYQERLNRKGVDVKPNELYVWLPGRTT
jgi:hypothetical protein